jgi:hypothetical protein
MAVMAKLNVRTVMSTVSIAEYNPTRYEGVVDDSVPATGLSSFVFPISLQSPSGWDPA